MPDLITSIYPVGEPRMSQSCFPVAFHALLVPTSNSRPECDLAPSDPILPNSKVRCGAPSIARINSSNLIWIAAESRVLRILNQKYHQERYD
jgi:hypothetical protein